MYTFCDVQLKGLIQKTSAKLMQYHADIGQVFYIYIKTAQQEIEYQDHWAALIT